MNNLELNKGLSSFSNGKIRGARAIVFLAMLICPLQSLSIAVHPASACVSASVFCVRLEAMPSVQGLNGKITIRLRLGIGAGPEGRGIAVTRSVIENLDAKLLLPVEIGLVSRPKIPKKMPFPPGVRTIVFLYWEVEAKETGENLPIRVTVTSANAGCGQGNCTVTIVDAPIVNSPEMAPANPTPNDDLLISANIEEKDSPIDSFGSFLYYRVSGEDDWNKQQLMNVTGKIWTARIPKQNEGNVEYYIEVADTDHRTLRTSVYQYAVVDLNRINFWVQVTIALTVLTALVSFSFIAFLARRRFLETIKRPLVVLKSYGVPTFLSSIESIVAYRAFYRRTKPAPKDYVWIRIFTVCFCVGIVFVVLGIVFGHFAERP